MNESNNSKIVDEHFWFTAITVGFNSFLIEKLDKNDGRVFLVSTIVSFYAVFLVLHRAAAHADKLWYPEFIRNMDERDKRFYHKGLETLCHFLVALKMIPIVVFEFSGALFYILLIVLSYIGATTL